MIFDNAGGFMTVVIIEELAIIIAEAVMIAVNVMTDVVLGGGRNVMSGGGVVNVMVDVIFDGGRAAAVTAD